MARFTHDILVVGGGAAGLTTASGSAQLGLKTALVEKAHLGGDCLYYGCVPSKALLRTASVYHEMRSSARFGLPPVIPPPVDMGAVNARVQSVIAAIAHHDSPERFTSLGTDVYFGSPRFVSPHEVELADGTRLSASKVVLAVGSSPRGLPVPGLADVGYITNVDVFSLSELPPRMVVIGAGPIGIEMAQAFSRLGSKVSVVDVADQILIKEDADVAGIVQRRLEADGVDVYVGASIARVEAGPNGKTVVLAGSPERRLEADQILVATGRQGNTADLDLDHAGVTVERSFIPVDSTLRTAQRHIMAIGDCNGQYLFTHVAGAEGSVAVRRFALGVGGTIDYRAVPWCTYTDPEIASVGHNERSATEAGIRYDVIRQPFDAVDRAQAEGETDGVMKILVGPKGRVIGTQIVGPHAGELLGPALFAVTGRWKPSALMGPIYPYPTVLESYKKAVGGSLAPRLFNDRVRSILRFLHRYRGSGPREAQPAHGIPANGSPARPKERT